jgi:urocanate hydratase
MYDYLVKGASLDASGASSIKVNVSGILKVHATGASSIDYKGNAIIKEMQSSGASSVRHKN